MDDTQFVITAITAQREVIFEFPFEGTREAAQQVADSLKDQPLVPALDIAWEHDDELGWPDDWSEATRVWDATVNPA